MAAHDTRIVLVDGYSYAFSVRLLRTRSAGPGVLAHVRATLPVRLRPLGRDGARVVPVWDALRARDVPRGADADADGSAAVFARDRTADRLILDRLEAADRADRYVVITDDRELSFEARRLGATWWPVAEAEKRLHAIARAREGRGRRAAAGTAPELSNPPEPEKPAPPGSGGVDFWLEYFGASDEERDR